MKGREFNMASHDDQNFVLMQNAFLAFCCDLPVSLHKQRGLHSSYIENVSLLPTNPTPQDLNPKS